jgi:hypothetical protein
MGEDGYSYGDEEEMNQPSAHMGGMGASMGGMNNGGMDEPYNDETESP